MKIYLYSKNSKKEVIYTTNKILGKYFPISRIYKSTNIILLMPCITPTTKQEKINDKAEHFLYNPCIHREQAT